MQAGIIKRVNQQHETLGFIALAGFEGRDSFDEQGLKMGGKRQIVRRTQGGFTEFGKGKPGAAMGAFRHMQAAPEDRNFAGLAFLNVGQAFPNFLHMGVGLCAEWRYKTFPGLHAAQAIIRGAWPAKPRRNCFP